MAEGAEKGSSTTIIIISVILVIILIVATVIIYPKIMYGNAVVEVTSNTGVVKVEHTYKSTDAAINHSLVIETENEKAAKTDITFKCTQCGIEKHQSFSGYFSYFTECECSHFSVVCCKKK